jgi:UDP-N-acetylmuramate dehydrogenase
MNQETVRSLCPELELAAQEPLAAHTTFRIGGPARLMAFPKNQQEFSALLALCAQEGETPLVLGNGSNVLAPDQGLDKLVICTKNLTGLTVEGNLVTVEAGCTMAKAALAALNAGLTGLEFAHGIPGTVGGGAIMNAGAYGGELKNVIRSVDCLTKDGTLVTRAVDTLGFGYRRSCFEGEGLTVFSVTMELKPGDPAQIKAQMEEYAAKRRASQPLEYPSAGSTFKRPEGHFAGRLIEDAGLKGLTVGGAQVSEKHAGFVINKGGATCADVLGLTHAIQGAVYAKFGVMLELEVKLL